MELRKVAGATLKILLPLVFGGAILCWMYRGFDFMRVGHVLLHEMDWWWMALSFPFGIAAQLIRGWRWRQLLEPVGERPRHSTCVNAVFLSYASSLLVPRIGEFARCGVLRRYDGVSFPKALGTVVTERALDTLLVLIVTGTMLLLQLRVFTIFFDHTGTSLDTILSGFSPAGYAVTLACAVAVLFLAHILLRRLAVYDRVKATLCGIWQGVVSLRRVRNVPLFVALTVSIWCCYFLHYSITFRCFAFTEHLGTACALVTFVVGSIAVVVPTPNGAGPWHFAVKTMLMLYGVAEEQALVFVLIVHAVQTLLVVLLGVWAWVALAFTRRRTVVEAVAH